MGAPWIVLSAIGQPMDVFASMSRGESDRPGLQAVTRIPYDECIKEADRRGVSLLEHYPESPAVAAIEALTTRLVEDEDLRVGDQVAHGVGDVPARGDFPELQSLPRGRRFGQRCHQRPGMPGTHYRSPLTPSTQPPIA
jgi:hypothetical protein